MGGGVADEGSLSLFHRPFPLRKKRLRRAAAAPWTALFTFIAKNAHIIICFDAFAQTVILTFVSYPPSQYEFFFNTKKSPSKVHRRQNKPNNNRRRNLQGSQQTVTTTTMFLSIFLLVVANTISSATATTTTNFLRQHQQHRNLDFNSYWDGEWQADNTNSYTCNNCDDDDDRSNYNYKSDVYIDDNIQQFKMAEQEIIRNVSIALMILLMLSCCICYPECIVLGYGKVKSWMMGENGKEMDTNGGGGDYVEMGSSAGRKMKKKRSKKKESSGSSSEGGLAASADVELV